MLKATQMVLLFGLLIACWVIAIRYEVDFRILYDTAKLTHLGKYSLVYASDGSNGSIGRYFYGPFSLVLIDPLGALPFVYAKWIWISLQTFCFLLFWKWLPKLFPWLAERQITWRIGGAWLLIYIVSINPVHNNFQSNNIQLMLYTVLVAAELLSRSPLFRGQFLAGMLVAVATSVKVYPLFIAVFYLITKPKAVRWGVVGGGIFCFILPLLFFGIEPGRLLFQSFVHSVATYQVNNDPLNSVDICSLPTMIARWFRAYPPAVSATLVKGLTLLISGLFFWNCFRKKTDPNSSEFTRVWALALALMAFLNPSSRSHYYLFYVPAFAALCEQTLSRKNWKITIGLLLSAGLIALTAQGVVGKDLNDRLEALSVPTWGMAILCACLAGIIYQRSFTKGLADSRAR